MLNPPMLRPLFAWGADGDALVVGLTITRGGRRDRGAAEGLARELLTTLRVMPASRCRIVAPDYNDSLDDLAEEPETLRFLQDFARVLEATPWGLGDALDAFGEIHEVFLRECLAGTLDEDAE